MRDISTAQEHGWMSSDTNLNIPLVDLGNGDFELAIIR